MQTLKLLFIIIGILFIKKTNLNAQNIGINSNGATPNSSAMLDVSATDKGLLIPRVSLISTSDITTITNPSISLLVYNSNASMIGGSIGFYYWNGTTWIKLNDGTATIGTNHWTANGNHISNANSGHVGIGTSTPSTPLHVKGQQAITLPNGGIETSNVTALINDTTAATGTGSKIGLYSIVKNHSAANVGVLAEAITKDSINNFGIIGNIIGNAQIGGMAYAIGAVDAVKNGTGALYIDGQARYTGVPNTNTTGAVLTNAGNGNMEWKESLPSVFRIYSAKKDTFLSNDFNVVRFNNSLPPSAGHYNIAGNYNSTTGELTITEAGFYHLTITYDYWMYSSTNTGHIYSHIMKNGNFLQSITQKYISQVGAINNYFGSIIALSNNNQIGDGVTFSYSVDSYFNVGDIITINHENDTDGNQYISEYQGSFSGYKIR